MLYICAALALPPARALLGGSRALAGRGPAVGEMADDDDIRALSTAELRLLHLMREERCHEAAALILAADFLLVATGAGMSAGCGLKTYRSYSADGSEVPVSTGVSDAEGAEVRYEELASPEALRVAPRCFYAFALGFYNAAADAKPTAGYRTLAAWQQLLFDPDDSFVFTSNVDGMHLRAGSQRVAECHGSKMRWQCAAPCRQQVWHAAESLPSPYPQPPP